MSAPTPSPATPPTEKFRLHAAAYLLLLRDGQVLLSRRYRTGWQDGNYTLVSGHLDGNEPLTTAMCREAKEEAGITIQPADLTFAHLAHHYDPAAKSKEYLDIYFTASKWEGEPANLEPEKCDDLRWFPLTALPENIVPNVKAALEKFAAHDPYSEVGWPDISSTSAVNSGTSSPKNSV